MNTSAQGQGNGQKYVDHPPSRVYWLPVVVCLAATALGLALVWSVRDQLPNPIITHWGADGKPDGFSDLRRVMVLGAVLPAAISLPLLALGAALKQPRSIAVVVAGTSVLMVSVLFGGTWLQGIAQVRGDSGVWWALAVGFVASFVVAWLVWLVVRAPKVLVPASSVLSDELPRLDPAPNGRVAWTGRLVRTKALYWFFALAAVPVVSMGVLFAVLGNIPGAVSMGLALLVVLVPFQMMFARVAIDSRGVRAVGPIRWFDIPLETIVSSEVGRTVSPMGDFGGYGLRGGFDGQRGLVTASAPTLLVHQAGHPDMYITVEHPRAAAATLNTLLESQRRGR